MKPSPNHTGLAYNRTRQATLATQLLLAATHWSRLRGLMCTSPEGFASGSGLWIVPCHGVHTFAMNFPIDVAYLSSDKKVVHLEHSLKPWRIARVSRKASSVLELPATTLSSTGTEVGDTIEISWPEGSKAKA
ncbi:MAG TPA: DUF192 domain-containing protein [Terriglobales bacterium]